MTGKAYLCERCGTREARFEARQGGKNVLLCSGCMQELNSLSHESSRETFTTCDWSGPFGSSHPPVGNDR